MVSLDLICLQTIWHYDGIFERIILRAFWKMPHTKSLHNYQGVNLSASTKLSWQKKPEQINNPEQNEVQQCLLLHIPSEFFFVKFVSCVLDV